MVTTIEKIYDPNSLAKQSTRELAQLPAGRWGIFRQVFGDSEVHLLTGSETTDGSGDSPVINIPNVGAVKAAFFRKTGTTFGHLQSLNPGGAGNSQFRALDHDGSVIATTSIDYEALVLVTPA